MPEQRDALTSALKGLGNVVTEVPEHLEGSALAFALQRRREEASSHEPCWAGFDNRLDKD